MGRLIATSDIHGCYDNFVALLDKIQLTQEDRLVLLGDYIDRGPKSKEVINLLLDLKATFPRTIILKGNHEDMFLDYLAGVNKDLFRFNGGMFTLQSYADDKHNTVVPDKHIDFIKNMPLSYQTENFFFCHAGVMPNVPFQEQAEETLLWIRDEFIWDDTDHGKIVVHGHTPTPEPEVMANRIGIDTGGVFGYDFTAVDLTDPTNIKFIHTNGHI